MNKHDKEVIEEMKTQLEGEMKAAKNVMKKALAEGDLETYNKHRDNLIIRQERYLDILNKEAKIKQIDGERADGHAKVGVYAGGTALAILSSVGLSLLYACVDATGSTGKEAKLWLKEVIKNRPIMKI